MLLMEMRRSYASKPIAALIFDCFHHEGVFLTAVKEQSGLRWHSFGGVLESSCCSWNRGLTSEPWGFSWRIWDLAMFPSLSRAQFPPHVFISVPSSVTNYRMLSGLKQHNLNYPTVLEVKNPKQVLVGSRFK